MKRFTLVLISFIFVTLTANASYEKYLNTLDETLCRNLQMTDLEAINYVDHQQIKLNFQVPDLYSNLAEKKEYDETVEELQKITKYLINQDLQKYCDNKENIRNDNTENYLLTPQDMVKVLVKKIQVDHSENDMSRAVQHITDTIIMVDNIRISLPKEVRVKQGWEDIRKDLDLLQVRAIKAHLAGKTLNLCKILEHGVER
ncbi:MAG: hypothetical protein A2381_19335 [Bdellovibrionales bacterium RIFOXYB1_FULL_37_110]|nr:MAG: hypothetical protein A2181_00090 [Bdellovibrionales bacterium RIFOXYA1_FULL_38_20]OFZ49531.1 MAG: hypothetical protein A2417_04485 [Bdellovibrionales bacterium RIFOXYC1_FULL_37_79]OFZ58685.1 MAG: hypothetical protein A2381_19335 [Bdellovibrionales bacterium RIFOXYB1_FULL_37_110]OFZ63197.1 MAG: hypothetical protein A2577_16750 [Bdellovibrionales bacterium RIFOXYD1_FULL_36_51]